MNLPGQQHGVVIDPVVDTSELPLLNERSKFKIMLMSLNTARGTTLTHAPGTLQLTWPETARLARAAEDAGMDGILAVANWKNMCRSKRHYDRTWEPFAFAAGVAAITQRVQIFATVHVPLFHPVAVAKIASTIDHIASGRFALNVVAGWNRQWFAMFGIPEEEHDRRYEYADEWMAFLLKALTEVEPFDFDGEFFHGTEVVSEPKPLQRPRMVVMNAGMSPRGAAFAAKYADLTFTVLPNIDAFPETIGRLKDAATRAGNPNLKFFGHGYIVCTDTEAEARRHFDYLTGEHIDLESAEAYVSLATGKMLSADVLEREHMIHGAAAGNWGFPLVGTPEQVAESIAKMHAGGLDGMTISFPNYDDGIAIYNAQIHPLLVEHGLRVP